MKIKRGRGKIYAYSMLFTMLGSNGGCGIEVGNPHGGKGGSTGSTGTVSVALADAPVDGLKHVYFNVKSLSAVDGSGNRSPLTLATTGKVDALDLQNGKSLDLASGQTLTLGDYAGAVLELDPTASATIVGDDGTERPLPFANGSHQIYIQQAFTVTADEHLDLVLHVDLRASLTQLTDKSYQFGPQASLLPRRVEAVIIGSVTDSSLVQVCAYRGHDRDFKPGSHLPHGQPGGFGAPGPNGDMPPPPPPPPPGDVASARPPHSFDQDHPIQFDDNATCSNAFTTGAIKSGVFHLHHLWPGNYKMRFFKADGSHVDGDSAGVNVGPGETATATVVTTASTNGSGT